MDITEHPVIRTLLVNLGRVEKEQKKSQKRIKLLEQEVKELREYIMKRANETRSVYLE